MKRCVCILGKPNVGKSSIFNRLIGEKKAITLDTPGVTRDRLYGSVNYKDKSFYLIDTGGIEAGHDNSIKIQAQIAALESDIILLVVDGKEELTLDDWEIRNILKKYHKPIYVLVNKIDNEKMKMDSYRYYELGYEDIFPVSAEHNLGFKPLLDKIYDNIGHSEEDIKEDILKFCLIGRPNVGKSSLINALLGEERVIVSSEAGTTRDAIDTKFTYEKKDYMAIDTAGLRKKGRIFESVEKYSFIRSLKAIDRADVCALIINADEGIIEHDKHIVNLVLDSGKALVIVVNKWDLVENKNPKQWEEKIRNNFGFIPWANFIYLSAKMKRRIHTLMPQIIGAYENTLKEIKTSQLNAVISDAVLLHSPPSYKGRKLKIYFVSQVSNKPPKFVFQVNDKGLVHFSYERYLENTIRTNFDLTGTPIIIQFKNKRE